MSNPGEKLVQELNLNSDSVFIDLGAGQGEEIAVCTKYDIEIHSFEPNDFLYSKLLNQYKNNKKVFLHNKAAWKYDGFKRFYVKNSFNDVNGGGTLYMSKTNVGKKNIRVETIDIAKYILNLNKQIDVLKIDVEGAEYVLLERILSEGVTDKIKYICFEDHSRKMPDKTWRQHRINVLEMYKSKNIDLHLW